MQDNEFFGIATESDDDFDPSVIDQYMQVASEIDASPELKELTLDEQVAKYPWRKPSTNIGLDNRYSKSRIHELDSYAGEPTIIGRMASDFAEVVQFPVNTAYLHGLGVFSSACVVNFQVEYNRRFIPVGLYTVCAQPSGSGKSSINDFFCDPIKMVLADRNRSISMLHKNADAELEKLGKQAEKAGSDIGVLKRIAAEVKDLEREKFENPLVQAPLKNTTPQAAEVVAAKQQGVLNVISDEAEALDTYLGISYTDSKKSPDHGVFMAAFGGSQIATARIGREMVNTNVRGAFSVVAQVSSVDTIIRAGASGRGVSERCLILKEPDMIGYRTYERESRDISQSLANEYLRLCERVLEGKFPINLTMSNRCKDMLIDLKNDIEPKCRHGALYGDQQMRGFASKIEQHVTKMAAIYHIAEQWAVNGKRELEVQEHNLHRAILVCMDLLESYRVLISSASEFDGEKALLEVVAIMKVYAIKGIKHFKIDKLRLSCAKESWYGIIEGKKIDYIVNLLLRAEEMNFCHVKETGRDKKSWIVLINPALADFKIEAGE